ncbi:MAG: MbtH family NRPS accessory protein [Xanthomonadales bacterium]|nr:MbtH family NRPS accessory protein [Xanthomonadales bacterium]
MSDSEIKIYECSECGELFLERSDLRRHIFNDHLDDDGATGSKAAATSRTRVLTTGAERARRATSSGSMEYIVARNKEGKCAVVPSSVNLPAGWTKKYGATTRKRCEAFKAAECGTQNYCDP